MTPSIWIPGHNCPNCLTPFLTFNHLFFFSFLSPLLHSDISETHTDTNTHTQQVALMGDFDAGAHLSLTICSFSLSSQTGFQNRPVSMIKAFFLSPASHVPSSYLASNSSSTHPFFKVLLCFLFSVVCYRKMTQGVLQWGGLLNCVRLCKSLYPKPFPLSSTGITQFPMISCSCCVSRGNHYKINSLHIGRLICGSRY